MSGFDKQEADKLADTIHEALNAKGESASEQKFAMAQKLLTDAGVKTRHDHKAQEEVLNALQHKLKQDSFHVEGFGIHGKSSYLIVRSLNGGDHHKHSNVYYMPITEKGRIDAMPIETHGLKSLRLPADNEAKTERPGVNPKLALEANRAAARDLSTMILGLRDAIQSDTARRKDISVEMEEVKRLTEIRGRMLRSY